MPCYTCVWRYVVSKKLVKITLSSITYSGDNIGRELSIEIGIENQKTAFNIKLKRGLSRSFKKTLFQQVSSDSKQTLSTVVGITERDLVASDYGSTQQILTINTDSESVESKCIDVVVQGKGWDKKRKGHFTLEFTISKTEAIRYITDHRYYGWLKVKFDQTGKITPLPRGLKVELTKIEKNREYFKVLEGHYQGYFASVKLEDGKNSYLTTKIKHLEPVRLTFYQQEQRLVIPGLGEYKVKMYNHNKIPLGVYDLQIPDDPKYISDSRNAYYMRFSKFFKSWFRIGNSGDRYLHMGTDSAGCITVVEKEKWTEIYEFLIFRRKSSTAVSTVEVK